MFFDEPQPALQLLDLLPSRGDALLQRFVFSLEESDPLPGLQELGTSVTLSLAMGQILLRLETALAPGPELFLERLEETLQLGDCGEIRTCVGCCQATAPAR